MRALLLRNDTNRRHRLPLRRSGPRARVCFLCPYPHSYPQFPLPSDHRIRNSRHKSTNVFASIVKDKAQHAVVLEKATAERLQKDVQSYRLITVATLVDRLKINGSLARKALADLEEKGQIKKVVGHSKMNIYTRAVTAE
ncbi:S25 ribosomal protein-domain-containing protein [Aspergillus filifer]